jgi:hypothetical protein
MSSAGRGPTVVPGREDRRRDLRRRASARNASVATDAAMPIRSGTFAPIPTGLLSSSDSDACGGSWVPVEAVVVDLWSVEMDGGGRFGWLGGCVSGSWSLRTGIGVWWAASRQGWLVRSGVGLCQVMSSMSC